MFYFICPTFLGIFGVFLSLISGLWPDVRGAPLPLDVLKTCLFCLRFNPALFIVQSYGTVCSTIPCIHVLFQSIFDRIFLI
jgi:hypothetical protein